MWTLSSAYFNSEDNEESKAKLIKCGEQYIIGRKDAPIIIKEAWISREHGIFFVGAHSEDDVFKPDIIPNLEYEGRKPFRVIRSGQVRLEGSANEKVLLQDMDQLHLHNSRAQKSLFAMWSPTVCLVEDAHNIKTKDCAKLGVKLCYEYHPSITQYVCEEVTGEPNQLTVLLRGGSIVTTQWLTELLRRSQLPSGQPFAMVDECKKPPPSDFLPPFSPNLNPKLHDVGLWNERQERKDFLQQKTFIFLAEGNTIASAWTSVMSAASATFEIFNVNSPVTTWSSKLKGVKNTDNLVLIADEQSMHAAVGRDWQGYLQSTRRLGLRFLPYERIAEAILFIDVAPLDCSVNAEEVDTTPGQLPNQNSQVGISQSSTRTIRRRQASAVPETPIDEPPVDTQEQEAVQSRTKTLKRRLRTTTVDEVLGLSDAPEPSQVPASRASSRAPSVEPVARPTSVSKSKLKRRVATQISHNDEPEEESVLDKHRKLYEATDPDLHNEVAASQSLAEMVERADQERTRALEAALANPRKRKAREDDEASVVAVEPPAISRVSSRAGSAAPPPKRRAPNRAQSIALQTVVEEENTQPSPVKSTQKSKRTIKPTSTQLDTDESYLKALASMKRGKKKEDQFDRDFNNLRIAKPSTDRAEDLDIELLAWEALPKDMDTRGNFMVCVDDVEVRQPGSSNTRGQDRPEWVGRPDFKKFKQKNATRERSVIELVANVSLSDVEDAPEPRDADFDEPETQTKPSKRRPARVIAHDSDDDDAPAMPVRRTQGRGAARSNRAATEDEPLFIRDSDVDQSGSERERPANGRKAGSVPPKRKATVLAASSSEDEGKARRKRRR